MASAEVILGSLDAEQRVAVTAPAVPLVIVAGAGTGKTRTITHRIAYRVATGEVDSSAVLAVTHSTKAAGEMRDRLAHLGAGQVTARTFHSAALALLKRYSGAASLGTVAVLENRFGVVRAAFERVVGRSSRRWGQSEQSKAAVDDAVFDINSEIRWAKASLVSPDAYAATALRLRRSLATEPEVIAKVYAAYEELRQREHKLDFEDLLTEAAGLLATHDDVARSVRDECMTFVVDEYQDTDPAQQRFLDAITGDRRDICVVGDPRQSIYQFKGADPGVLDSFTRRFSDALVVNLLRDYRSTPEVVAVANSLIPLGGSALVGQRPPSSRPRIVPAYDEAAEEQFVVREIKALLASGTPRGGIAVLYRYNAQSARFEAAFTEAGIPYKVGDDERFFERPEIRQPLVAFGKLARQDPSEAGLEQLREVLFDHGFDPERPPAGAGAARGRFDAQAALVEMVSALPDATSWNAGELLREINRRAVEAYTPTADGVTLSTLHKAKGLEYDAVFLVGLVEGSMPSGYATTTAQIDEERRLLYVGITRARIYLRMSWAQHRPGPNGDVWSSKPSRFLDDLEMVTAARSTTRGRRRSARLRRSALPESDGKVLPSDAHPRAGDVPASGLCPSCRTPLRGVAARRLERCSPRCLSGGDLMLYRALAEWRSQHATSHTASDRALFSMVAARPTTAADLEKIAGLDKKRLPSWTPILLSICGTHPANSR